MNDLARAGVSCQSYGFFRLLAKNLVADCLNRLGRPEANIAFKNCLLAYNRVGEKLRIE